MFNLTSFDCQGGRQIYTVAYMFRLFNVKLMFHSTCVEREKLMCMMYLSRKLVNPELFTATKTGVQMNEVSLYMHQQSKCSRSCSKFLNIKRPNLSSSPNNQAFWELTKKRLNRTNQNKKDNKMMSRVSHLARAFAINGDGSHTAGFWVREIHASGLTK